MDNSWLPYGVLRNTVHRSLDAFDSDQTEPPFHRVFDTMVAICALAGPEETIFPLAGDFASVGSLILYEKWSPGSINCELDVWILTIAQNDGGFSLCNLNDPRRTMSFSHEEEWEPRVHELLEQTYWRPLNWSPLLSVAAEQG